jgi:hypothetical protein
MINHVAGGCDGKSAGFSDRWAFERVEGLKLLIFNDKNLQCW